MVVHGHSIYYEYEHIWLHASSCVHERTKNNEAKISGKAFDLLYIHTNTHQHPPNAQAHMWSQTTNLSSRMKSECVSSFAHNMFADGLPLLHYRLIITLKVSVAHIPMKNKNRR